MQRMERRQAEAILDAQRALVDSLVQALTALEAVADASRRIAVEVNSTMETLDDQAKLEQQRKFAAILNAVKQMHEAMKSVLPKIR